MMEKSIDINKNDSLEAFRALAGLIDLVAKITEINAFAPETRMFILNHYNRFYKNDRRSYENN
jgi:hypothetical protein